MNNSIAFILKKIEENQVGEHFVKEHWEEASIINPMQYLQAQIKDNYLTDVSFSTEVLGKYNDITGRRKIFVQYNPLAKFEYFSSDCCTHDGTLLFEFETINNILKSIMSSTTYNKATVPNDYEENFWKYDINYIIGDIIVNTMHGDFGTPEKPWLHSKTTTIIPIAIKYIRNS